MTIRAEILAETLARLEVERYAPSPRSAQELLHPAPQAEAYPPVTPEQAAHNRRVLLDAISDDPTVVAFRERTAS